MCKNWVEKEVCSYQNKCRFAHGTDEMKSRLIINNKYRSKPCFEFHKKLYCSYGVRCLFYHNDKPMPKVDFYSTSLKDPRIKIDQMAEQLDKIILEGLANRNQADDIILELTNLVLPQKSKFGFELQPIDDSETEDELVDDELECAWFQISDILLNMIQQALDY